MCREAKKRIRLLEQENDTQSKPEMLPWQTDRSSAMSGRWVGLGIAPQTAGFDRTGSPLRPGPNTAQKPRTPGVWASGRD